MVVTLVVHYTHVGVEYFYTSKQFAFYSFSLSYWLIIELAPILFIFMRHYQNFKSIDEDINTTITANLDNEDQFSDEEESEIFAKRLQEMS